MQLKKGQKRKFLTGKVWIFSLVSLSLTLGLLHYLHIFNISVPTNFKSSLNQKAIDSYIPLSSLLGEDPPKQEKKLSQVQLRSEPTTVIEKRVTIESQIDSSKSKWNHPQTIASSTAFVSRVPAFDKSFLSEKLNPCSDAIASNLKVPILSPTNRSFCEWALDPSKGGLVVGKSWGKLNKAQQKAYESLNCNFVLSGTNPTCDDTWGDGFVSKWRSQSVPDPCPSSNPSLSSSAKRKSMYEAGSQMDSSNPRSSLRCYVNSNDEKFCRMTQASIDFSRMKDVSRHPVDTRSFEKDFLSIKCPGLSSENENSFKKDHFPFPNFLSFDQTPRRCDVNISGTTLLYSHDEIRNYCHTLQDIMNVWMLLWLITPAKTQAVNDASSSRSMGRTSESSVRPHDITFLSVDALRLYNNFHDTLSPFYEIYHRNFKSVRHGVEFGKQTVCFDELVVQALPPKGFVWDSWDADNPCSLIGPSSLFQRFNLHARNSFGVFSSSYLPKAYTQLQVLLIIRSESANPWGDMRTSRLMNNPDQVHSAITRTLESVNELLQKSGQKPITYKVIRKDLANISIAEQMLLMSDTSILVGMHGAGIANIINMPIGAPNCCGVIETIPKGEFTPARGYGNMARKLNIHYRRIDLSAENSGSQGSTVPIKEFSQVLQGLVLKVVEAPTCVLPSVIRDPYLEG